MNQKKSVRTPVRAWILSLLVLVSLLTAVACTPPFAIPTIYTSNHYIAVKELLKTGDWKAANVRLVEIMLDVTGQRAEGKFDDNSIQNFPCADMVYIDQLVGKYSENKFGFTAQKEVYMEIKKSLGNISEKELFLKFADRVGWRKNGEWVPYNQFDFSANAPKGQLLVNITEDVLRPSFKSRTGNPKRPHTFAMIMERLAACTP